MNFELFYQTSGVCTDTRNITPGCLFICLKGEHFNGNNFAFQALEAGASFVVCDEKQSGSDSRIYYVENTLIYLQQLAAFHRQKFQIPFIGITGSNGKTTTKELTYHLLSKKYKVLATKGNLNNHIGVPLTLLQVNAEHEIAIIEMGANKPGDIKELCDIASPTHGIITNIGRAHLEGFINFEGVLHTKKELYDAIEKQKGVLFYNSDDSVLTSILPIETTHISYSMQSPSDYTGELVSLSPFINMKWKTLNYTSATLSTQMIGKYNFYNFMAAISIASSLGVDSEAINEAVRSYLPQNNRSQLINSPFNTIIMDAYNANPTSMKSAIESFAMMDHPSRIAILGDMFELGNESPAEHKKVIELCRSTGMTVFYVGERFSEALNSPEIHESKFLNKEDLIEHLKMKPLKKQLILLKGSRGIGLESILPFL